MNLLTGDQCIKEIFCFMWILVSCRTSNGLQNLLMLERVVTCIFKNSLLDPMTCKFGVLSLISPHISVQKLVGLQKGKGSTHPFVESLQMEGLRNPSGFMFMRRNNASGHKNRQTAKKGLQASS